MNNRNNTLKGDDLFLILRCLNEILNGYRVEDFEVKFGKTKSEVKEEWVNLNREKMRWVREENADIREYFNHEEILLFFNAITEVFICPGIDKEDFYYRVDLTIPEAKIILEKFNFPIPESIKDDTCWNKPKYITNTTGLTLKERLIKAGKFELVERIFGDTNNEKE